MTRGHLLLLAAGSLFAAWLEPSPAYAAPASPLLDSYAMLAFTTASAKPAASCSSNSTPSKATSANVDWVGLSIAETLRDVFERRGLVTLSRDDLEEDYNRVHLGGSALL